MLNQRQYLLPVIQRPWAGEEHNAKPASGIIKKKRGGYILICFNFVIAGTSLFVCLPQDDVTPLVLSCHAGYNYFQIFPTPRIGGVAVSELMAAAYCGCTVWDIRQN